MTGENREKWDSEATILALFLLFTAAVRIALIRTATINPDELFLTGGGWRVSQGVLPFLGYMDVHPPLLAVLSALPFALFRLGASFIDLFRVTSFLLTSAFMVFLYLATARNCSRKTALLALAILNSFVFVLERTTHARESVPAFFALFAAIWLITTSNSYAKIDLRFVLAAALTGIACQFHLVLAIAVAALCVWILLESRPSRRISGAIVLSVVFGAIAVAAFFLPYLLIYRGEIGSALTAQLHTFQFNRLYQQNEVMDFAYLLSRLFLQNPIHWAAVFLTLAVFNVRLIRRRIAEPFLRLCVLMADAGLAAVILAQQPFEHRTFLLVFFTSVLAAVLISDLFAFSPRAGSKTGRLIITSAVVLIGVAGIVLYLVQVRSDDRKFAAQSTGSIPPGQSLLHKATGDEAIAWLDNRTGSYDSFTYRPYDQRRCVINFFFHESDPGETVLSDWQNPPLRALPAAYHHGNILYHVYTTHEIETQPAAISLLSRYDSAYSVEDHTPEDRMVRLLNKTEPRIIYVEGNIASLFRQSTKLRNWVANHYQLVIHSGCGAAFAILPRTTSGKTISGSDNNQ